MQINQLHSWQLSIDQAKQLQTRLASLVSRENELTEPHLIAGCDISAPDSNGIVHAAVIIVRYPSLEVVEEQVVEKKAIFPYVPGLLSFRESPLLLTAFENLSNEPDLILVDGQGIAHPRHFGIASHLGLILNIPTIGCAKSRLCGHHKPLATQKPGAYTNLIDNNEIIGAVVITKNKTNPIYVSIGHKIDLPAAIFWVLECCNGYRLPEPCRLAHLTAGGKHIASKQPTDAVQIKFSQL